MIIADMDLDSEDLDFIWKNQRDYLIDMVRDSRFPRTAMARLFDVVRQDADDFVLVGKLAMSHPDPGVRADATAEMLSLLPLELVKTHLWR